MKDKNNALKTKTKNQDTSIKRPKKSRAEMTKDDYRNNPTGKGGFRDNPQNRSDGSWRKEGSFSYWLNKFKRMNSSEFETYALNNDFKELPVAAKIAYQRIVNSLNSLREFQEVANRTEGAPERITINNINAQQNNDYTDPSILADVLKDVQKDIKLSNELRKPPRTNNNTDNNRAD